jgi:hypothetical protein
MVYESTFNDALNQKRGSCEQAGGGIVRETIALFKESRKKLFTMEELVCKLRRLETEREKEAFFWFFGTFLESVCGKRNWGRQKWHVLVSEAIEKGGRAKMVTKSDEAFALLIFENYVDKWATSTPDGSEHDDRIPGGGEPETTVCRKRKQPRLRGSTPTRRVGTASMVGGVMREYLGLMICTSWYMRTGLVHRLRQWKGNYWRFVGIRVVELAVQTEKRIEGLQLQGQALWTYHLLRPRGIWMINSEHCAFVSTILINL